MSPLVFVRKENVIFKLNILLPIVQNKTGFWSGQIWHDPGPDYNYEMTPAPTFCQFWLRPLLRPYPILALAPALKPWTAHRVSDSLP